MRESDERIVRYITFYDEYIKLMKEINKLVRCKDCKHRPYLAKRKKDSKLVIFRPLKENPKYEGEEDMTCPFLCDDRCYDRMPPDDFFCAYGKR